MKLTCDIRCGCGDMDAAYACKNPLADELLPLCFLCRIATLELVDHTIKMYELLICRSQGIARVDMDRAGGDVVCSCGKKYYDHPDDADYNFLTVLCDGSLVKL